MIMEIFALIGILMVAEELRIFCVKRGLKFLMTNKEREKRK